MEFLETCRNAYHTLKNVPLLYLNLKIICILEIGILLKMVMLNECTLVRLYLVFSSLIRIKVTTKVSIKCIACVELESKNG